MNIDNTENNRDDYENISEIRDDILNFRNDIDTLKLEHYYKAPSYAEILGVSRKENCHSNFLAWLLDDAESHSLSYFPIKKFLEILANPKNEKFFDNHKELYDAIITDDISISELKIEREKTVSSGNLDLYLAMTIHYQNSATDSNIETDLNIILENKVTSKEHKEQTQRYYDYFNGLEKNDNLLRLYIFLTPLSTIDLDELEEPECSCKEFIQINYQALVDYIFQPILNRDINDKIKIIIQDYLQSLSQPALNDDTDYKKELVMAVGKEERELLDKFLEKNKKLIWAALSARASDPDTPDEERNTFNELINQTRNARDRSLYSISYENNPQGAKFRKADIGHETIRVLDKHGLLMMMLLNF